MTVHRFRHGLLICLLGCLGQGLQGGGKEQWVEDRKPLQALLDQLKAMPPE